VTRRLALALLACGLAPAAPVPKASVPKIEDVFGEIADPKSECRFKMGKDGALTVTVPTAHPRLEPGASSTTPPLVGRKIEGDFELTVRVSAALPKTADGKGNTFLPAVLTGISVVSADDPNTGITVGAARRLKGSDWVGAKFASFRESGYGGATEDDLTAGADEPIWFRLTRSQQTLHIETSGDGKKWKTFVRVGVNKVGDAVTVGPVAFGCLDTEFSVTFDQYELKPLKEGKK